LKPRAQYFKGYTPSCLVFMYTFTSSESKYKIRRNLKIGINISNKSIKNRNKSA
jgi:hypothetical protein